MATTYTYFREIYDVAQLYDYIKATLTTLESVDYSEGTIDVTFPAPLSGPDKTTLDGLIVSYSNPQVLIEQNQFRKISVGNSSTTNLGSSATFSGFYEDVSDFSSISVIVYADVASASDGLKVFFSSDGTNADVTKTASIDAADGLEQIFTVSSRYVKVDYVNGASGQSDFRLQTIYHYYKTAGGGGAVIELDQGDLAPATKILGKDEKDVDYHQVQVTQQGAMKVTYPNVMDHELRVGERVVEMAYNFIYFINNRQFTTSTTGSGSVTHTTPFALIQSGAAGTSSGLLKSCHSLKAKCGYTYEVGFDCYFSSGVANNTQIVGIGTTEDGLFFGYNGTSFGVMIRGSSSDTWIAQTAWNFDKLDGTGVSKMTLDPTNGNHYVIQFGTANFGEVRFLIKDETTGELNLVHKYLNINSGTTSIFEFFSLAVYVESKNTSNTSNEIIRLGCIFAKRYGNRLAFNRNTFSHWHLRDFFPSSGFYYPITVLHNKTTLNGLTNYSTVYIDNIKISSRNVDREAIFQVWLKDTDPPGTGSYTDIDSTYSCVEYVNQSTRQSSDTAFGNLVFSSGFTEEAVAFHDLERKGCIIPPDFYMTLTVRIITSDDLEYSCGINWHEE